MNTHPRRQILWSIVAVSAVVLTACGESSAVAVPTPAGAATGRDTFVYVYSDN